MISKLIFKDHKYNLLTILIICFFAIALIIFLGSRTNEEVQNIVQEQFNEQQLLLARQSTDGIEEFLNQKTIIIEILANEISDKPPDEIVDSFINVYNKTNDIHVIEFINESGIVTLGYPEENSPLGYDLYEKNDEWVFEKTRDNKETYISNPIFLLEGGMGVFIWTPIYEGDEFKGIVLVIIKISDISDRFLKNCKSQHEVYMIDKRGTILYDSSNRYRWGRNYLEKLGNESPRLQQILHQQMNGSEGTGYYLDMNGSEKRLIAYSPIYWRNQLWSVAVTSQVSEVDTLIKSIYVKHSMFIGVSGIFLLLGSFSIILLLTRWNKSLELEVASKTSEITESNELLKRANKKLMELDKLKSDFVSMVSHELKTPLTPMKTSAEFLLQNDPDVNVRREMLELIVRNIDRQTRMVNDMLDISRIESGNMRFRKDMLDIGEIINSAIETIKKQSEEKKINITTDIPTDLLKINADKDKLIQVFINLLSNALKFTPNGGNVEIKANESEKYIEVYVKDDGIGISPDKIDKIFNKFYQIDNTSTRSYGGSGLGLVITKSIMKGHGGTIRVESTLGEGSVFILTFLK
ncbi:MAG: sensor histidine kinase [Methanosarcinales archaeon]|nr:sensor histidine kinase [Methanosarcinales archaeon]